MNRRIRYLMGFAVMGVMGSGVLALALKTAHTTSSAVNSPATEIVFEPALIDVTDPPFLPGDEKTVSLRMRNLGSHPVLVRDLKSSDSIARVDPSDLAKFPMTVSPDQEVLVHVLVRPEYPLLMAANVRIHAIDGQSAELRGIGVGTIIVDCIGRINSDPVVASFGTISKNQAGHPSTKVRLWHPARIAGPRDLDVSIDDPAMSVTRRECHSVEGSRVYFGELEIAVDTQSCRERFRGLTSVKSEIGEVRIPVLGFVGD